MTTEGPLRPAYGSGFTTSVGPGSLPQMFTIPKDYRTVYVHNLGTSQITIFFRVGRNLSPDTGSGGDVAFPNGLPVLPGKRVPVEKGLEDDQILLQGFPLGGAPTDVFVGVGEGGSYSGIV